MYEDSIHAGGVLKGLVLGAVLGVLVYTTLRQKFDWIDRRIERLDRELGEHVQRAAEHAHQPLPDAPPT